MTTLTIRCAVLKQNEFDKCDITLGLHDKTEIKIQLSSQNSDELDYGQLVFFMSLDYIIPWV